ncbi:MAG: histidine phosphatase family protein [Dermatophilaceae bacterium]
MIIGPLPKFHGTRDILLHRLVTDWTYGRRLNEAPPGGESAWDVWRRLEVVEKSLMASRQEDVVAFTHYGVIRLWVQLAGGPRLEGGAPDLLQACRINYAGGGRLVELGEPWTF